jgi:propanol-preferring alcohol dehydrogenase
VRDLPLRRALSRRHFTDRALACHSRHEVAGTVEAVGREVDAFRPGDRVCVHYLAHCGACDFCLRGNEQFCPEVQMIGKHRDGGYAEFIKVPARSLFALPDEIPFAHGAIMMCSSATALHAAEQGAAETRSIRRHLRLRGFGYSALQLRARCRLRRDLRRRHQSSEARLAAASAHPISHGGDARAAIRERPQGKGSTSRSTSSDGGDDEPGGALPRILGRAAMVA